MGKLESLKWIPLLIKAYSDVQVKRALESQSQPSLSADPAQPTTQTDNSILPPLRSGNADKRTSPHHSLKTPQLRSSDSVQNSIVQKKIIQKKFLQKKNLKQMQLGRNIKNVRKKPVQPETIGNRTFPNTKVSNISMKSGSYQHLIQELRETQKKLNRLEDIHKQSLREMQTQLEQQIDKLAVHLESKNKQEGSTNPDSSRTSKPIMIPPYF